MYTFGNTVLDTLEIVDMFWYSLEILGIIGFLTCYVLDIVRKLLDTPGRATFLLDTGVGILDMVVSAPHINR